MKDVLVTGYPSLDYIVRVSLSPRVGETARLYEVPDNATYGGCGLNVGAALARLGFEVGAAVVFGGDREGKDYLRYLQEELGIDVSNVSMLSDERTSRSYLFLNPDGQYQNFFFSGAADAWQGPLVLQEPEAYRYALVTVGPLAYNRQFMAQVGRANVPIVWSMKPDIQAYPPDMLDEFVRSSAYLLMNHIEARYVAHALGYPTPEWLLADERSRLQAIVVTNGAKGAEVYQRNLRASIPAAKPRALVDTTGAGDGFAAGFLAALLRGYDVLVGVKIGVVVASFVLEAFGCQTNLPDWAAVWERYRRHFGALPEGVELA